MIKKIEDYEPFVGAETIDRIHMRAKPLLDRSVENISSTYYGGGVATKLSSLALLMNGLGIHTGWRIIQGNPDFFRVTKGMHNALQSGEMDLTDEKKLIYEEVNAENAVRNHLHHDFIIVHDPQPLPLIDHYPKRGPWIWRCHIDLSNPHTELWAYLRRFIDKYDAAIVSIPEYAQRIRPPQFFHMPTIDPFALNNRDMTEAEIVGVLEKYNIPTDLPLVVQVSRFDIWKDPQGVIEAYKIARREANCRLILLGSSATDDPEGEMIFRSLLDQRSDEIMILNFDDSLLVNALQRKAAVVIQKSIREGFGLTVTEAMWKGTAVIGGNVGGIRYQIQDGTNGFLVSSVNECAERIVTLLKDPALRERLGVEAKETVRRKFLMTRLVEQYINLLNSFEVSVRVRDAYIREQNARAGEAA